MESFIFGGRSGIKSPQELAKRREIVQALMARAASSQPKNLWEGLNVLAHGIGSRLENNRLDKTESEGQAGAKSKFDALLGGLGGGSSSQPSISPASYSPQPLDNVKSALLNTIAGPESAGQYDVMYGGGKFKDFADHPRQAIPITSGPNAGKTSSAAGKYQFLGSTWDQQKDKLHLPDFSPESQDAAAWDLAATTFNQKTGGNLADVLSTGDPEGLKMVAKALARVWTSLPGGIEQGIGDNSFANSFQKNLGTNAQPAGGQPMQVAQAGGGIDPALLGALSDPWMNEGQQTVIKALLERELANTDPKNKLEVRKLEAEINALENPKSDPFTLSPGQHRFDASGQSVASVPQQKPRPATPEEKKAFGVGPDVPLVIGEDGKPSILSAGGVNINMPNQPTIGNIPPGYEAYQDPATKAWTMRPIQGGPAATEEAEKAKAEEKRVTGEQQRGGIVTQDIDRALGVIQNQGMIGGTGFGSLLSSVPGTDAKALSALLDTVRANIGFEELNKMRQQSPTGGALGQVTERELAFLQSVAGSLDQAQSQEQLTDNLNRLWNSYQDVIHGSGKGPPRRPLGFEEPAPGVPSGQPDAEGWTVLPNGARIREKK